MPSKKSPAWNIRIDALAGVEENLRPWCEKHGAVLAVKEWADDETSNPHFHIALRVETSDTTVRKWVKELLPPGAAKSDHSVGAWDGDEKLLRYYCKGPAWHGVKTKKTTNGVPEPPVVIYTTLLDATITSLHTDYWKANAAKSDDFKKPKKAETSKMVIQEAVAYLKDLQSKGQHITYEKGSWLAFSFIFDHPVYKGRIGRYALQPMVQSVLWSFDDQLRYKLKKAMFQQIANGLDLPGSMGNMTCSDSSLQDSILHV